MTRSVSAAIHRTSAVAAVTAAVLSPLPLVDELLLLPLYGALSLRIGRAHGLPLGAIPWRPIARTALSGLVARAGVNLLVSFVPGVAAVANATSAVALTELFGRYVDESCAAPSAARPLTARSIVERLRRRQQTA